MRGACEERAFSLHRRCLQLQQGLEKAKGFLLGYVNETDPCAFTGEFDIEAAVDQYKAEGKCLACALFCESIFSRSDRGGDISFQRLLARHRRNVFALRSFGYLLVGKFL